MDKYIEVENISDTPILKVWNESLLTDAEDIRKLQEFKMSEDFLGRSQEEKEANKKIPHAILLKPFFSQLGKGVLDKSYIPTRVGNNVSRVRTPEYKFSIGVNPSKFKENDIYRARQLAYEYDISYTENDTVESILQKFIQKFGDYKLIMTEAAYLTSGLKALELVEIKQKLQLGESSAKVIQSGLLKVKPHYNTPSSYVSTEDMETLATAVEKSKDTVSEDEFIERIESLDYPQLQEMAKNFGIKANKNKEALKKEVIAYVKNQ